MLQIACSGSQAGRRSGMSTVRRQRVRTSKPVRSAIAAARPEHRQTSWPMTRLQMVVPLRCHLLIPKLIPKTAHNEAQCVAFGTACAGAWHELQDSRLSFGACQLAAATHWLGTRQAPSSSRRQEAQVNQPQPARPCQEQQLSCQENALDFHMTSIWWSWCRR